jgi:hypothetical protein
MIKKNLIILLILTTGIIFLGKSFYNANLINSLDFRYLYDLTKLLFDKLDIYELYLIQENVRPFWGKWSDNFIFNNEMPPPQWGHILYFFLFPYVIFPYEIAHIIWFISNLIFLYLIIKIVKKNYNFSFNQLSVFIIMIICSTPLTNTLGNGQFGLLLLLLLLIYWHSDKKFFLGFLCIKITVSAFFVLHSFLKKEISFVYFVAIYLIGIIFYSYFLNDYNLNNLTNHIQILFHVNNIANENASYNGVANLRAVLKIANIEQYYNHISILFVLLVSFFILKKKDLDNYNKENFLILNNLNLLIFYHAIYDFIFLIPLLAYTIVQKLNFKQKFTFYGTIVYFFYFIKINRSILNNLLHEDIINILGFSILIYTSLLLYRIKNYL